MKQSLSLWEPNLLVDYRLESVQNESGAKKIIIFEAKGEHVWEDNIKVIKEGTNTKIYLLFGPEGGMTDDEIRQFPETLLTNLTDNRLRSETAVVYAASVLRNSIVKNIL